ncbi:MAG: nucleotidyltransferase [Deltaproteobacteria bacterium]|nr:nucleotidyltransferase [Deltaproteobacteria bacterium]
MTLADVSALLERQGIRHAIIGATALAVHGVTRSSEDVDFLVTDRRCLEPAPWQALVADGVDVDIRRGDADDPLAGVVRLRSADSQIDVIVGRGQWQNDVLTRARPTMLRGTLIPVVTAADLVLLKLYAGGPQDAWDVDQLLDAVPTIEAEVTAALPALPTPCARLWQRILADRTAG